MTLGISSVRFTGYKPIQPSQSVDVQDQQSNARGQLSNLLFGKSVKTGSQITFGWTKGIPDIQEKILDELTNPSNKSALVVSHGRPDGDAFGTAIGISGILKSLGVKVTPVIDDRPSMRFGNFPSPDANKVALDYIYNSDNINSIPSQYYDLAIITDSSEPTRMTPRALQGLGSSGKVIIIDHHSDDPGQPTNKDKWISQIKKLNRNIKPENILYWREGREAASEMISELDKEIVTASQKGEVSNYQPQKNKVNLDYRLATAAGILTDSDGDLMPKGQVEQTKFVRASKILPHVNPTKSATKADFEWLVSNAATKIKDIDMRDLTIKSREDSEYGEYDREGLNRTLDSIITNKQQVRGITVIPASKDNPVAYLYVSDYTALEKLGNRLGYEGKLKKMLNWRMQELMIQDKNCAGYVFATKQEDVNSYSFKINSYGESFKNGDYYQPGALVAHGLAREVLNAFSKSNQYYDGYGSNNFATIKGAKTKDFMRDALPLIQRTVKQFMARTQQQQRQNVQLAFRGNKLDVVA